MGGAHESVEHVRTRRARSAGHNRKIALGIAVLALFLAFSETLGQKRPDGGAQLTMSRASNLWAFFQAKTNPHDGDPGSERKIVRWSCRQATDPAVKAAWEKQIDAWQKAANRYDDEPSTNEGRKQLSERAIARRACSRLGDGSLSPLRGCLGGVPNRHRAVFGSGDHRAR